MSQIRPGDRVLVSFEGEVRTVHSSGYATIRTESGLKNVVAIQNLERMKPRAEDAPFLSVWKKVNRATERTQFLVKIGRNRWAGFLRSGSHTWTDEYVTGNYEPSSPQEAEEITEGQIRWVD